MPAGTADPPKARNEGGAGRLPSLRTDDSRQKGQSYPLRPKKLAAWRTHGKLLVAHMRAMLRNRYDSALLVVGVAALVVLVLLEYLYQALAHPPPGCASLNFFVYLGVPRSCEPAYHVSVAISIARVLIGSASVGGAWQIRVLHVQQVVRPQSVLARRADRGAAASRMSSFEAGATPWTSLSDGRIWGSGTAGWAVASSKQTWLETTSAMYSTVSLALTTTLSMTCVIACAILAAALVDEGWTRGASWDYACRTCSDGGDPAVEVCMAKGAAPINLCFLSWHARIVVPFLISGQAMALTMITYLSILATWDPVAVEAGQRAELGWLARWRVTHMVTTPFMTYLLFPLLVAHTMELYEAPRLLVEVFGCSSIVVACLQSAVCVWVLHGRGHGGTSKPTSRPSWLQSARALLRLPQTAFCAYVNESSSLHTKRQFLLAVMAYVFASQSTTYGAAHYVIILALRGMSAAFFLLARDTPASFHDLRRDRMGPGFGLVVDVCMLREALERHLGNDPPHDERLPMYKATVYRMEAAMAGGAAPRACQRPPPPSFSSPFRKFPAANFDAYEQPSATSTH